MLSQVFRKAALIAAIVIGLRMGDRLLEAIEPPRPAPSATA